MSREPDAVADRGDLFGVWVEPEELAAFNKASSPVRRRARDGSKPMRCRICGKTTTRFCHSHTIPQHCLKEISEEGKLLTFSSIIGGNLVDNEVGMAKAQVFGMICRECDSSFFKAYETPESLAEEPTNQMMGQIAAKCLLSRIAKFNYEIELDNVLGARPVDSISAIASVRAIDLNEDEALLRRAITAGRRSGGNSYRLMHRAVLPYTAPFAFQQAITPISDFEGNLINNLYCQNQGYRTEPIFTTVLPTNGRTVVMLFRSEKAKRYRRFESYLNSLPDEEALLAIVKLIFAYSEDVLLSKRIDPAVLNDGRLRQLARMDCKYSGSADSARDYRTKVRTVAAHEFAINRLPDPPALLSREFALK